MVQCWCSWWFRWTTTSVQTGLYLKHQKRLGQFEANSFAFIDCFHWKPIPHTQQVSASPLAFPATVRSLQHASSSRRREDKLIDQLSEWPFYYHPEIRTDFFFLLKRFQVYVSFAWDCLGFGWWLSKSLFCRWHPTGGNYGSQLPWSSVWDGTALGTALTNKSKLLEWSRRRTYSKQRFPALSQRVL